MLLNFVNEDTKKKFVMTEDFAEVCETIGWYQPDVSDCGGIKEFVKKHQSSESNNLVI